MHLSSCPESTQYRWLGFELSILRRLKFRSVAIPFAGDPGLELPLKRWGVRVSTNDSFHWAWTKAAALVENNTERLDAADLEIILEEAYAPRHKLANAALRRWFGESEAWWFDNVRENLERLNSPAKRALALTLGMSVGDYVFSFDDATREFASSLSRVFLRLWENLPTPIDNRQRNVSTHVETRAFLAEQNSDLLFLRLPPARRTPWSRSSVAAWREEWVRGGDSFWPEVEAIDAGHLGSPVATKRQYLDFIRELLERAAHLPAWAVAHVESDFITTDELIETVRSVRRVETIYTKDFSELTGARAAIITAL